MRVCVYIMKWVLILLLVTVAAAKSSNVYKNIAAYEDVVIADTESVCANFLQTTYNISEKCSEQLEVACENQTILTTLLDASSKFPYAGLAYSSRSDFGNFDQCMSVNHAYNGTRILGEYCTVGLIMPDIFGNISDVNSIYQLAVCRPDGCSAQDYNNIIGQAISETLSGVFIDGACVTIESNSTFTAGDIATLTVFGVIILLMCLATGYDYYLYLNNQKTAHPILIAFSVLTNGRKLLHISSHVTSKEHIETFYGLRVISMIWIVAGHGMAMWGVLSVTNADTVNNWQDQLSSFYIVAANLSVDTFFFMSGFLLAFQYFKGKAKSIKQQVGTIPFKILHRYLRLTPALLMIYLVTITFYIHLSSGPIWSTVVQTISSTCEANWWRFFLYIQNYFPYSETCLPQTWYLSADMQLFLIALIILIPLSLQLSKYGFKMTVITLFVMNIFFVVLPIIVQVIFTDYSNEYDTHSRLTDYFIGVMLALFMRAQIDKPFLYMIKEKHRTTMNLAIWPLILPVMLAVLILYQDAALHYGPIGSTIYKALLRPVWCIGLCWVTYSCYHGQGGFINWLLCRKWFQVIGRLTYCIYLLHISVMLAYIGTFRTKWYFSEYVNFYIFCGHYIMSVILATFWALAFESPLIVVEKYIFGRGKSKGNDLPPEKNHTEDAKVVQENRYTPKVMDEEYKSKVEANC